MPVSTLEERVATLEKRIDSLSLKIEENPPRIPHRWELIVGSFADSEGFEDAVRLGREYREAQPYAYEDNLD